MKLRHWHPNQDNQSHYLFRRDPEHNAWLLWFGLHVLALQFACKCAACKLKRRRAWLARWFHVTLTDEQLEQGGRFWGQRGEHVVKQAITQARFREAMKAQGDEKKQG